jgi:hypothetical protein
VRHPPVLAKRIKIRRTLLRLNDLWGKLDSCFQEKYMLKIERDIKRFMRLEKGLPVPPSRLLDEGWISFGIASSDYQNSMQGFLSEVA